MGMEVQGKRRVERPLRKWLDNVRKISEGKYCCRRKCIYLPDIKVRQI